MSRRRGAAPEGSLERNWTTNTPSHELEVGPYPRLEWVGGVLNLLTARIFYPVCVACFTLIEPWLFTDCERFITQSEATQSLSVFAEGKPDLLDPRGLSAVKSSGEGF